MNGQLTIMIQSAPAGTGLFDVQAHALARNAVEDSQRLLPMFRNR